MIHRITAAQVIDRVLKFHGCTLALVCSKCRTDAAADVRAHMSAWLREATNLSWLEIGAVMGLCHSTAHEAAARFWRRLPADHGGGGR